jgi:hypothetical protein
MLTGVPLAPFFGSLRKSSVTSTSNGLRTLEPIYFRSSSASEPNASPALVDRSTGLRLKSHDWLEKAGYFLSIYASNPNHNCPRRRVPPPVISRRCLHHPGLSAGRR